MRAARRDPHRRKFFSFSETRKLAERAKLGQSATTLSHITQYNTIYSPRILRRSRARFIVNQELDNISMLLFCGEYDIILLRVLNG